MTSPASQTIMATLTNLPSLAKLLKQGQQQLTNTDNLELIRVARLEAQILLCHTLGVNRTHLYMAPEEVVSEQHQQSFFSLIEHRLSGVPIAHLTGQREFWSLDLVVNQHTLIPRPETELLVETALNIIQQDSVHKILDLGTGSGAIALALATERPESKITATDISSDALSIAEKNMSHLNISNVSLHQGHWFDAIEQQPFDMIVSNPPYIADDHHCLDEGDVRFEPRMALTSGKDGLDDLCLIIKDAVKYLRAGGWLLLEHGYDQKIAVQNLLEACRFEQIKTLQDYAGHDRLSLAQSGTISSVSD